MQNAETGAKIKTGIAANGVDVNSGSAVGVQEGARETGQLDAENVMQNADLTAYGFRTAQTSYQAQAALDEQAAEDAPIGGALSATGGLLSSASAIGMKYPSSWFSGGFGNTSLPNNTNGQIIGYNV